MANIKAIEIDRQLKKNSKQIDTPDLMIAASAISNGLKLATLNFKHFGRIGELEIVSR
jgi:tRNA(fMet)-specific endonuclease VapC